MNRTVASLTSRSLLGRRRTLVLLLLPLALLALCVLARVLAGLDAEVQRELEQSLAPDLLGAFGVAILMPLLSLIAGTGSIGPEIDDGSIVYLLAKPLNRYSIVLTKLMVAIGVVIVFGVLPVAVAGVVLTGEFGTVTFAYAVGALVAGVAYSAVFLLLAVTSRNAVVLGLIYALIWESLVGALVAGVAYSAVFLLLAVTSRNAVVLGLIYALIWESLVGAVVPGAQTLSIQQWSLAVVQRVLGDVADQVGLEAAVGFGTGAVLLAIVTVTTTGVAGRRLQTLRLNVDP